MSLKTASCSCSWLHQPQSMLGWGFHSHECKRRSVINRPKADQPFEVAKRRTPAEARRIADKSHIQRGFPGGAVVKNTPTNVGDARDTGSISGSGRSPEEGNGSPVQYSYLGNPMDRGAWQAAVHGATKGRTRLSTHVYTQWTLVYSQNWATITHYQS